MPWSMRGPVRATWAATALKGPVPFACGDAGRGSRRGPLRRRSSLPAPAERRCGPGKPCSTVRACSRSLEAAQQATDGGWMPFAATRCSNPARVQFQRNGSWRYGPRRLNLPDEGSQCLRPNERRLPACRAGPDPAGSRFDHSQSPQHANDGGVVPAAVALRRHAPPVQFVGYCAAGNDTACLQFAKRRREGPRNCAPFFHDRLGWLSYRSHGATVIAPRARCRWFCVFSSSSALKATRGPWCPCR